MWRGHWITGVICPVHRYYCFIVWLRSAWNWSSRIYFGITFLRMIIMFYVSCSMGTELIPIFNIVVWNLELHYAIDFHWHWLYFIQKRLVDKLIWIPSRECCLISVPSFLSFLWWCLWWFFGLCLCLFLLWNDLTFANTRVGPPAPPISFIGATVVRIPLFGNFSKLVSWTIEYRFLAAISCLTAFPVFPGSSMSTHSVPIPRMLRSLISHETESSPKPEMIINLQLVRQKL